MSDLVDRIAAAPISWGVDGSPGWGHLMSADRVMAEMRECGLAATELGPDGFLPTDPEELAAYLAGFGLDLVGGFVPAVLYRDDGIDEQLAYVDRAAAQLARGGSKMVMLAADSHLPGYDTPIELDDDGWTRLMRNLERTVGVISSHGLLTALHPHWGMAVLEPAHIERVLESTSVGLCLDTGHVQLGGGDPIEIARRAGDRIYHVHLKDLDGPLSERVRRGETPFRQATLDGLFVRIGTGAVDIAGVIRHLEDSGYRGWYALEQDCALDGEPLPGQGPIVDALASVEYLRELAAEL